MEDAGNIERTETEMAVVSSQPESSIGEEPESPMEELTTKDVDSVEPMDLQEGCSFENDREDGGEVVVDEEKMEDGSQDSSISVAGNDHTVSSNLLSGTKRETQPKNTLNSALRLDFLRQKSKIYARDYRRIKN